MKVWDHEDYKTILRERVAELSETRRSLSLKRLAASVPMQYTYLSRVLNRDDTHLTEDQLYSIGQQLDFYADELEYVFLLRGLAVARHEGRREFLKRKLEHLRRSHETTAPVAGATSAVEASFLLSPLAWVIYFSLGVKRLRENPKLIAQNFALSEAKVAEILRSLSENSLIEIDGSPWRIVRILKNHFHYGPSHPLTRIHQQLLKDYASQHLLRVAEDDRVTLMATFNADGAAFGAIQARFKEFIRDAEKLAIKAPSDRTFQLNVDLFPWN